MKTLLLLFTLSCTALFSFGQVQPVGNLTVFSEDGDRFYLILNGEKQNEVPQTNIRIEELPQPYYNAKVIFENGSLEPIAKNLMVAGADGTMMDITYRIKKDKTGKAKLSYYSAIPVPPSFIAPPGMFVRHFGQPQPVENTTTTTTTYVTPPSTSVNVNIPGVNLSIGQPVVTQSTTQTTVTSTTTSNRPADNYHAPASAGCDGYPMAARDFSAAKKSLQDIAFEETKLSTAKGIASANCLATDQIVEICNLFGYDESKLAFAKHAFKSCVDQKNYFKVTGVFSFDSSKDELNHFLEGN